MVKQEGMEKYKFFSICRKYILYGVFISRIKRKEKTMADNKRCAIYNRYSVNATEILEQKREELITYCEESLGIPEHELFEEVGSCLDKREVFDQMMARIENKEFSDVLVFNIDRIYKLGYDHEKLAEYVDRIRAKAVIHTLE